MEQELPDNAILSNPFNRKRRSPNLEPSPPWIRYVVAGAAVASLFGVIALVLTLAVPISMLVIGIRYRDSRRYCPIEPRISLFLIVGGSVSLVWIFITIIISLMAMFFAYTRSMLSIVCIIVLSVIVFVGQIFSLIWLIVGSVWTFSIRSRVQHRVNYYDYDSYRLYCHQTLYQFTFIYLIIIYILIALQLCCRCFACVCRSRQKK